MQIRRPVVLLASIVVVAGCPTGSAPDPVDDPCREVWGIGPEDRLHVDASAPVGGDGSADEPFANLDDALAAARESRSRSIVLGPGEYVGHYILSEDNPAWLDSGLELAGCGRDETTLRGTDDARPIVQITGASTMGITLRDLATVGGRRAISVEGGAGAAGAIEVRRVLVEDSVRLGVLISGAMTVAHLLDVEVRQIQPDQGSGWGIAILTSANAGANLPSPTLLEGVVVRDVTEVGILADGAWVELISTRVAGVAPNEDGLLGRGIQLQQRTAGLLDTVTSTGNSETAVYLHKPGRADGPMVLDSCTLSATYEVVLSGGSSASDGLAVSQGETIEQAPDSFGVEVRGTSFVGNGRIDLLVEGVAITLGEGNSFDAPEPFVLQGGATATGAGVAEQPPSDYGADLSIDMFRADLGLDDLVE